ncbi:MAG: putative rane protein [Thermoplasmata archaeon]|jgi:putative membrane protein|nr:putative rane protein [Thermoplasmata archaeon]
MIDLATLAAATLVGAAAGLLGLLPGLHANTLAAVATATLAPHEALVPGLAAMAATQSFASLLPGTYLGVPDDDLGALPAHRLVLAGRGREAVRAAADATLAATLVAVPLGWLLKWLLLEPGNLRGVAAAAAPWTVLAALAWVLAREQQRLRAAAVLAASAALGWACLGLRPAGLLPIPASPLLPLLSGLFGAAGLLASLRAARLPPQQPAPRRWSRHAFLAGWAATLRGSAAALWTAVTPGATPAMGATLAYGRGDARASAAALAAVGAAHHALSLGLLWTTGQARTGIALAVVAQGQAQPWTAGRPPTAMLDALAATVAAAVLGWAAVRGLDRLVAARVHQWDPRRVPLAALALLVALVGVLAGPLGLAILVAAALVGLLPIAWGVRRIHLVGALAVPIILRTLAPPT